MATYSQSAEFQVCSADYSYFSLNSSSIECALVSSPLLLVSSVTVVGGSEPVPPCSLAFSCDASPRSPLLSSFGKCRSWGFQINLNIAKDEERPAGLRALRTRQQEEHTRGHEPLTPLLGSRGTHRAPLPSAHSTRSSPASCYHGNKVQERRRQALRAEAPPSEQHCAGAASRC